MSDTPAPNDAPQLIPVRTLERVSRRYDQLKVHFADFAKSLDYFANPRPDVPGVKITVIDTNTVTATLADITVRFNLLPLLTADNVIKGRVICRLENEEFRKNGDRPLLGTFTFGGNGKTDFRSAESEDEVMVQYNAVEIAVHYLALALRYEPQQ